MALGFEGVNWVLIFWVTLIIIGITIFGLALVFGLWFGFLRWYLYPIKAIVEIPSSGGGYLLRFDRMRVSTKKDGTIRSRLLKDPKAVLPETIYEYLEMGPKGKRIIFLKRIGETDYIPIKLHRQEYKPEQIEKKGGKEVNYKTKPIPSDIRNWIISKLMESYKRYKERSKLMDYIPLIGVMGLIIAFVVMVLFIVSKAELLANTGKDIASSNKELGIQLNKISENSLQIAKITEDRELPPATKTTSTQVDEEKTIITGTADPGGG